MMRDAYLTFDADVAITNAKVGGTALDLGKIKRIARGQPVYINVIATTAATSTADTMAIDLIVSDGAEPGSGDKVLELMPATAASAMTAGKALVSLMLPPDLPYDDDNYVNVRYAVTSTSLASLKVYSFLTIGAPYEKKTTA